MRRSRLPIVVLCLAGLLTANVAILESFDRGRVLLTLFDSTLGGNSGASSLSQRNAGLATRTYIVRGRRIDDVVVELGLKRVDVLKADVEGAEQLVIRGAAQTLRRFQPTLILEVVPRQLENMRTSVEELEGFLKSLGYNTIRSVDYKNRKYTVQPSVVSSL